MLRREFLRLIALVVGWRAALFAIGMLAPLLLPAQQSFSFAELFFPTHPLPAWLAGWVNFDGILYALLAESGYGPIASFQAFFPMLPMVFMRPFVLLAGAAASPYIGLAVTNLATLLFVLVWFAFVKQERGAQKAWTAVYLVLLFPTALFLGALYTESVFLLATVGAFYAARNQRWALAGILAAVASATRIVGIALVPALLLEHYLQYTNTQPASIVTWIRQSLADLVWISIGSLGLLSYMTYLWYRFADPLMFVTVQSSFGAGRQQSFVLYPQVVARYLRMIATVRPIDWKYYAIVQEAIAGIVPALLLARFCTRIRPSYCLYAAIVILLGTTTGTFLSLPRFLLTCFPFFLLLTDLLENRPILKRLWIGTSTAFLVLNTILFIQGFWVA